MSTLINTLGVFQPDPSKPSTTRGANFMFEALRVGAEETALHFMASRDEDRERELGDVKEFIGFCRDLAEALEDWHLDQKQH